MRFRHIFMGVGTVFVLFLVFFSDPSVGVLSQLPFGSGLLGILVGLAISQLYIGLLHISRKGLFDYLDLEVYFKKAYETSLGASIALVAVALAMVAVSIVILAASK